MNTRICDALSILPRIGIFCDYLDQELNQLEKYASSKDFKTTYFVQQCNRIRDLVYMVDEVAKDVCTNVNDVMED